MKKFSEIEIGKIVVFKIKGIVVKVLRLSPGLAYLFVPGFKVFKLNEKNEIVGLGKQSNDGYLVMSEQDANKFFKHLVRIVIILAYKRKSKLNRVVNLHH
jgi:hypothetical protein